MSNRTCFVVQGFGKKTDFTDGRVLDLDASYAIIKEAVQAAGLDCLRADEIPHTGVIDRPMYEMLLQADLVIADLSTYNVNAAFELGIRYGLRPGATIIVAEAQFKNPFDVSHIVIHSYKHLGEDIGVQEAKRFRSELAQAIEAALSEAKPDSPVYTFLPDLRPPERAVGTPTLVSRKATRGARTRGAPGAGERGLPPSGYAFVVRAGLPGRTADAGASGPERLRLVRTAGGPANEKSATPPTTAKDWLDEALGELNPPAGRAGDAARAVALLRKVHEQRPNDVFDIQQLALATARCGQPNQEDALRAACHLLREISPETTNDPETLSLWGAIHQQLWELRAEPDDLAQAIAGYDRCFRLKQDCASGSKLAFVLDLQALESLKAGAGDEAIADAVQARRVRREVVRLSEASAPTTESDDKRQAQRLATLWEASLGLGDLPAAQRWEAELSALPAALALPAAVDDERRRRGARLQEVQAEYARLLAG